MQHILLLIFFVISPILIFAQDADTEKRMQELGFVKVDLNTANKPSAAPKEACSSCALKQAKVTPKKPKINYKQEIERLKYQLPRLEQAIKAAQIASPTDPMLQKYQTALKNTKDRIDDLEKKITPSQSSHR